VILLTHILPALQTLRICSFGLSKRRQPRTLNASFAGIDNFINIDDYVLLKQKGM
jgi:hypothetical protein